MRPSPTDSATWYEVGTYKKGNDGNIYTIQTTAAGIHRWVQAAYNNIPEVYTLLVTFTLPALTFPVYVEI